MFLDDQVNVQVVILVRSCKEIKNVYTQHTPIFSSLQHIITQGSQGSLDFERAKEKVVKEVHSLQEGENDQEQAKKIDLSRVSEESSEQLHNQPEEIAWPE